MARTVNIELNLTAFIDLMSCLIIFLLTTAVWNQIDSLSTNTDNTTASDKPSPEQKKVSLAVTILPAHIEVSEDAQGIKLVHVGGEPDIARMISVLNRWRQKYPDRKDLVLNTENRVPYRHMIKVFDTIVGADWPDVGVNTQ